MGTEGLPTGHNGLELLQSFSCWGARFPRSTPPPSFPMLSPSQAGTFSLSINFFCFLGKTQGKRLLDPGPNILICWQASVCWSILETARPTLGRDIGRVVQLLLPTPLCLFKWALQPTWAWGKACRKCGQAQGAGHSLERIEVHGGDKVWGVPGILQRLLHFSQFSREGEVAGTGGGLKST